MKLIVTCDGPAKNFLVRTADGQEIESVSEIVVKREPVHPALLEVTMKFYVEDGPDPEPGASEA